MGAMRVRIATSICLGIMLAIASSASAQSINVNFSEAGSTPSSSYAAAGGAGMWNTVTGLAGQTFTLFATDGSPTGVTVIQQPTATLITTTDPSVSGDDAILLNHGLVTTNQETCLAFSNMHAGSYEVLVYAWLPLQPTVKSRTRQDEAPSTIDVGGAWPGHHEEGITYARYMVQVSSDGMLPAHSGLAPNAPAAALNAVQIRLLSQGADGAPVGLDATTGGGNNPDGGLGGGGGGHGGCATTRDAGPGALVVGLAIVAGLRRRRTGVRRRP